MTKRKFEADSRAKTRRILPRYVDFGTLSFHFTVRFDEERWHYDFYDIFHAAFGENQAHHALRLINRALFDSETTIDEHTKRNLTAIDFGRIKYSDASTNRGRPRISASPRACLSLLKETMGVKNCHRVTKIIARLEQSTAASMGFLKVVGGTAESLAAEKSNVYTPA